MNVRRKLLGRRKCNRGRREVSTGHHREGKQKAANVCANDEIDENRINKIIEKLKELVFNKFA